MPPSTRRIKRISHGIFLAAAATEAHISLSAASLAERFPGLANAETLRALDAAVSRLAARGAVR